MDQKKESAALSKRIKVANEMFLIEKGTETFLSMGVF